MKILYHHRTRAEDAQGIHIGEIINAFQKLGHRVDVVGLIKPQNQRRQNNWESWISRFASRIPPLCNEVMEILYNIYGFYLLCKKIKNFSPNIIYERYSLFTIAGVLASKIFSIPLILEVNAPLSFEKLKYSKLCLPKIAKLSERWVCSNSHKTIVVTTPLKRILEINGVPGKKMVVIPNGINPDIFNPNIDGNGLRKQLKLDGKIVVGFVGWFKKWHGIDELLRVYADYNMYDLKIHILLVGHGPAYTELDNLARQNERIKRGVTFIGTVARNDVPKYIAAFDIAIQPNVTDYACPIKLVEYMGMGKAIVAPNKKNVTEILTDRYEGLFKAGNYNNMAEAIINIAKSKRKMKKLGIESAKILNKNNYFWTRSAQKALNLVNK